MRDHLAHRYFDTAHAILQATVDEDLPDLERAVQVLTRSVDKEDPDTRPRHNESEHLRTLAAPPRVAV
jgi:hypothetical protein